MWCLFFSQCWAEVYTQFVHANLSNWGQCQVIMVQSQHHSHNHSWLITHGSDVFYLIFIFLVRSAPCNCGVNHNPMHETDNHQLGITDFPDMLSPDGGDWEESCWLLVNISDKTLNANRLSITLYLRITASLRSLMKTKVVWVTLPLTKQLAELGYYKGNIVAIPLYCHFIYLLLTAILIYKQWIKRLPVCEKGCS